MPSTQPGRDMGERPTLAGTSSTLPAHTRKTRGRCDEVESHYGVDKNRPAADAAAVRHRPSACIDAQQARSGGVNQP